MELEMIFKMLSRSIYCVMWYIMAFPVVQCSSGNCSIVNTLDRQLKATVELAGPASFIPLAYFHTSAVEASSWHHAKISISAS